MTREMLAAVVMVWLIGALVGWFTGWAARGEQNRAWHRNLQWQLTATRAQLDAALAELDATYIRAEAHRLPQPAAPAVVNVHLTAPLPWPAQQPLVIDPTGAMPVLPGRTHDGPVE